MFTSHNLLLRCQNFFNTSTSSKIIAMTKTKPRWRKLKDMLINLIFIDSTVSKCNRLFTTTTTGTIILQTPDAKKLRKLLDKICFTIRMVLKLR